MPWSEIPDPVGSDIPDTTGRKTRKKRRRRTQTIAKHYTFPGNAKTNIVVTFLSDTYQ